MFQQDLLTSVGYLAVAGRTQNARWANEQNSLIALDPLDAKAPRFRIANLGCEDRDAAVATHRTVVQSIRMISCDGSIVWSQQDRAWSSALVGMDRRGRALLLHVRSPYTMHDLVDALLALPLDLVALHYGEGGPEASLYVRGPGFEERNVGSFETGFVEDDSNVDEWPLPNVLVALAPI